MFSVVLLKNTRGSSEINQPPYCNSCIKRFGKKNAINEIKNYYKKVLQCSGFALFKKKLPACSVQSDDTA